MFRYKVEIKKVSGRLNERCLPSKNLIIKSKKALSENTIFKESSSYFRKNYGLIIEMASIESYNPILKGLNLVVYKLFKNVNDVRYRHMRGLMYLLGRNANNLEDDSLSFENRAQNGCDIIKKLFSEIWNCIEPQIDSDSSEEEIVELTREAIYEIKPDPADLEALMDVASILLRENYRDSLYVMGMLRGIVE